jgi:hypothetical protein
VRVWPGIQPRNYYNKPSAPDGREKTQKEWQMSKISLTDFVDIVSSSGIPKVNKVLEIKNRNEYHPAFDYYKGLREHIIEVHRNALPKALVKQGVAKANHPNKVANYAEIAEAYHSWWGKKDISWFEPVTGTFERHGVTVSVNPELGLEINGTKHLVKLYFKSDKLTKNRVDMITFLMNHCIKKPGEDIIMSILDIRNKKLFTAAGTIDLSAALAAELAYVAAILS